ncbi:MAG: FKBP-type peptidyl-prolyl cis-trans isomerase [Planctomycetaceae bacterium]|nr:FKBP-type peptidyl-prolyl cis-trans isomerase [Planctomycetaceae bacterium]
MIELEIPSELGYGEGGFGRAVPPGATLHFIVELIKVERSNEPSEAGPRDPDAPEEFSTTASGLKYRILRKSSRRHPSKIDWVKVHYKGWLDNGTVFDSSYVKGMPTKLQLGHDIIQGWTEGIPLIGKGGMIELEIPSELGYGEKGASGIPGNATLHFVIELLDVD